MSKVKIVLVLLLTLAGISASAQYYDKGSSPSYLKWRQRDTKAGTLIYPDYFERGARRMEAFSDSIYTALSYGLSRKPLRMPIVVHTENSISNGLAVMAPNRVEMTSMPPINTYATEWYAQLATHEFRHSAQYANTSAHFFRPLRWLVGQQAGLASMAMVPVWFLEGDAVMTETQMSSFGRALQPSFTIAYRAYLDKKDTNFRMDKWFTSSFRDYIPSHYHLGYQLVRYSQNTYGVDMWDRVMGYTSRYPFTIIAKRIALKKHYNTSIKKMFDSTMLEMKRHWDNLPPRENSSTKIVEAEPANYTTYTSPIPVNDTLLYALRSDYDRPTRLVAINPTNGAEHIICYTGDIHTPLSGDSMRVWWSERRHSTFWEQKVMSRICYYDFRNSVQNVLSTTDDNAIFPTVVGDSLAYIAYNFRGDYSLVMGNRRHLLKGINSVHGMAYDNKTGTMALIVMNPEGMWLCRVDLNSGEMSPITKPSRVSLAELTAGQGALCFRSIESGYDEIHTFDLNSGTERRLTTSRYGSFSPSPIQPDSTVYMTTYSQEGYILSRQKYRPSQDSVVRYTLLPRNIVNLPLERWDVPNIDSIALSIAKLEASDSTLVGSSNSRSYRKGAHLFNIHSWMPLGFDPFNIVEDYEFDFAMGVTLMTQNLLGTLSGNMTWRHTDMGHGAIANLRYSEFPVKVEFELQYGGRRQTIYGFDSVSLSSLRTNLYLAAITRFYLPLRLADGYRTKTLTPLIEYSYINALKWRKTDRLTKQGLDRLACALSYSDYAAMAYRDILPRWGMFIKATSISAPFAEHFGTIWALSSRFYLPSFWPHHSLSIRQAVQYQRYDTYNFLHKELYPRGAYYDIPAHKYIATALDYQLPLAYPDWGITSLIFIKRLRLNLGLDYARFNPSGTNKWDRVWSYGGTFYIDMNPLRIPTNTTTLSISVYRPSDKNGIYAGVGLVLPL